MTDAFDSRPVVVGIDGSKSAVRAAVWAADEAIDTDSTLLLLHVVDPRRDDQHAAMAEARHVLRQAWDAVLGAGKPVKIDSDILHGDAASGLVNASRSARVVCVGHKGTHDSAPGHRGATASQVAEDASCTTVVVRHRKKPSPYRYEWIIAVLDESPDSHAVLQTALKGAMLRKAAVLALTSWSTTVRHHPDPAVDDLRAKLDRYLNDADRDNADVLVRAIPMPDHIFNVLEQSAPIDQLVVIGTSNPDLTRELLSRRAAKILRNSDCSLMIARGDAAD
jgi:nucleotide-binding universal stress UspA family protein